MSLKVMIKKSGSGDIRKAEMLLKVTTNSDYLTYAL